MAHATGMEMRNGNGMTFMYSFHKHSVVSTYCKYDMNSACKDPGIIRRREDFIESSVPGMFEVTCKC